MPSTNQYDSRRPVYVKPFSSSGMLYGFLTNVRSVPGGLAGHTAVPATRPRNLVFGASAPKPGRVTFVPDSAAGQYDSTFYDFAQFAALRARDDVGRMSKPTIRRGRSGVMSKTVYVTIGADGADSGFKYAWRMGLTQYNNIGTARTALGITDATDDDRDLVWGSNDPKPPKATRRENGRIYTTFYDPSRELPAGWVPVGSNGGAETIQPGE